MSTERLRKKTPPEIVRRQTHNLLRVAAEIGKYNDREKMFSVRYQIKDRPPVKKRSKSYYSSKRPRSSDITYRWNDLVADAWHTHHILKKGVKAAQTILRELPNVDSHISPTKELDFDMSKWTELRESIVRYGIKPSLVDSIGDKLYGSNGEL